MAAAVVGSTPISFTNSEGAQKVVPLSAFQYNGSDIQLDSAWTALFDANETKILLALVKARAAVGELAPPPVAPRAPAIALTATHPGPESNGIVVTSAAEHDKPVLAAKITMTVTETDTYASLATGDDAAKAIGVDAPTGNPGDPLAGTGLVVVKQGSTGAGTKPAVPSSGVLTKATGTDLKDSDNKLVLTLQPRPDYVGKGGLSYQVTTDGMTFTVSATYDSTKETGTQAPVTLQTLGDLAAPVAYLLTATAPPAGATLPADSSVQLSGGGAGQAANGLLYTS